ncbi:MAG: hypothetical protein IIA07_07475 [Proteobacteria bacterium]|nr:hypothetical protein [Pseudomonadota bacterium]
MEAYLLTILYESLISVTLTFITVVIPFSGAYWMYKKASESNAESAIFQVGREIATELHAASILVSPLAMVAYTYIDKHILEVDEQNRDTAIHQLLTGTFRRLMSEEGNEQSTDDAILIVAIATDRFESLVPPGVNWAGKGPVYDFFGAEITVDDQLFPFGTKLYRQWVKRFSVLYNDLWVCTSDSNRDFYVKHFAKWRIATPEDYVNSWLDSVKSTLSTLNVLHSKVITQIQIIDNSVNEKYFLLNLVACVFYIILLSITGYFLPLLLHEFGGLSLKNLLLMSASSAALFSLIVFRLLVKTGKKSDVYEQRKIFLPQLMNSIKEVTKRSLRLKRDRFDNLLSMRSDLGLSNAFCGLLADCSGEIEKYNRRAEGFFRQMSVLLEGVDERFSTRKDNLGAFVIALAEIPDEEFDLDVLGDRILRDNLNFSIEYIEQHLSRTLHTINLTDLSENQRVELVEFLRELRQEAQNLSSYEGLVASWLRLSARLSLLEQATEKLLAREPFDLINRWARNSLLK